MQKRDVKRGRPRGTTTYDASLARAFGDAVRSARMLRGIAQEELAALAEIERSHMGKIERGEHMPTLALIFKIAKALDMGAAELMTGTQANLEETNGAHA